MSAPSTSDWVLIQIKPEGPHFRGSVSAEFIRAELKAGRLSWTDMVFAAGRTMNWTRICDIDDFRGEFPQMPESGVLDKLKKDYYLAQGKDHIKPLPSEIQVKPPVNPHSDVPPLPMEMEEPSVGSKSAVWYFQFQGSEYGPVTRNQLQEVLEKGKAKGQLYIWRQGLKSWIQVSSIQEFAALIGGQGQTPVPTPSGAPRPVNAPIPNSQANLRAHARHALVATVFLIIGAKWKRTIGVCGDISTTGFQLIMDSEAEFVKDSEYTFEIHPAETSGTPAFHASGKCMWVKAGERRAGFLFTKMSQRDQDTLKQVLNFKPVPAS